MKNKEKYFDEILEQWMHANFCSFVKEHVLGERPCLDITCNECNLKVKVWLEQEYSPLDDKEREYLKGVIRPWRNKVKNIEKVWAWSGGTKIDGTKIERILIRINDDVALMLPFFMEGTMYKGMEVDKEYSLEDLGI